MQDPQPTALAGVKFPVVLLHGLMMRGLRGA